MSLLTKQETIITTATKVPATGEAFLSLLRELSRTHQAVTAYSDQHLRQLGLTPAQFDVIATLGNTLGLTMNKLADKTLVTKGTLTGIVDRLEQKGLVRREVPPNNRRCFRIVLTPEGEQVFEQTFPAHIAYLKQRFEQLRQPELEQLSADLERLRKVFETPEPASDQCD